MKSNVVRNTAEKVFMCTEYPSHGLGKEAGHP